MRKSKLGRLLLSALLVAGIAGIAMQFPAFLNAKNVYQRESSATPTPTSDNRSMMLVTYDPNNTPTPTVMLLKLGARGDEVTRLQERLKELGYYSGIVDGQYGNATAEAVSSFQRQTGLTADGMAGQNTLSYLYMKNAQTYVPTPSPSPSPSPSPTARQVLKNGMSGEDVKQLQKRLAELGYYSGTVDGAFGGGTEEAVRLFQSQNGLTSDGIAGTGTTGLLYSENARKVTVTPTPDPDALPILVNRTHPVESTYKPSDLVNLKKTLPSSLVTVKGSEIEGTRTAAAALQKLFEGARADGVTGWQISAGYRSYAYQEKLFNQSVAEYMEKGFSRANAVSATRQTVADPGSSEHHTGLAFDITTAGTTFKGTKQQKWLDEHCWEYGFIIRYQESKEAITGYLAECWHIRYVGFPHSVLMRDRDQCLEEYLGILD